MDELRSQGQVVQSRELSATIALLGVMLALYALSGNFIKEITELMKDIFAKDLTRPMDMDSWTAFTEIFWRCGRVIILSVMPIVCSSLVLGVLVSVAQTGFLFTTETLSPDFSRLNPIGGLLRLFSFRSVTESFKSFLKVSVIGAAIYTAIKNQIDNLPGVIGYSVPQLMIYVGQTTIRAFSVVGILLLGTAVFDYWIQWRRFRSQAMMTKAEAKQELKEREGDPQIKARIRSIQRDAARKRMMKSVPKADVVITNPTHIAVAIIYDAENGFAPKVIAKGGDYLAERIKAIAREHGIPTVENKPLARTLYKHVKVGQMIPRSLYHAVAEILAYVYKLKGRKLGVSTPS
ncbi:MAG: flagellar biosynthesis protein FlhB [Deltaproteobacteria bacterium]|nr:flagellar biosynthesis protein FlhB [Deltaproteobacteria bacterium]